MRKKLQLNGKKKFCSKKTVIQQNEMYVVLYIRQIYFIYLREILGSVYNKPWVPHKVHLIMFFTPARRPYFSKFLTFYDWFLKIKFFD